MIGKIKSVKHNVTASDNVYEMLRSNIIRLKLMPGAIISIKELSDAMGIGRSPVRDAVIRLEKEGLITTLPQRGTMISKIDLKRVEEERYLRECLEEKTILIFAKECKPEHIKKLRENIEMQKKYAMENLLLEFHETDHEFHKVFFEVTNKNFCYETIMNISGHYQRIRLLSLFNFESVEKIIKQHENIVSYLEYENIEKLKEAIADHLKKLHSDKNKLVDKYPELFQGIVTNQTKINIFLENDFLKTLQKSF